MVLNLDKAILREIKYEDLEMILKWRNQNNIRNVMYNNSLIEWEEHLTWYKNLLNNNTNRKSKIFRLKNKDLGVLNINNIDSASGSCNWGFYVGEKNTIKGTGLYLGYTSLQYIFSNLGLRKICAEVIESNIVSRNFHEKLGFKLEGILRKHIRKNDTYEDVYLYSIFNEEWIHKADKIKDELEVLFSCHK